MQNIQVKAISAAETWPLRHTVMWPEKPFEYVQLERDLTDGHHLGLFVASELVSVISWFRDDDTAQFRKFATLNTYQNNGYGTQLLNTLIKTARKSGVTSLWCNARVEQIGFYEKFGLRPLGERFTKNGRAFIVMSMEVGISKVAQKK